MTEDQHAQLRRFLIRLLDDITRAATHVLGEVRKSDPDPRRLGSITSFFALGRLIQSFRAAASLLRRRYTFEAVVVMRLILEQLAWIFFIHEKDKGPIHVSPQKCITSFKSSFDLAGTLYGALSEVGHLNPKHLQQYIRIEPGEKESFIYAASGRVTDSIQYSLVLYLLVGMYGMISELATSRERSRQRYLDSSDSTLRLSRSFLTKFAKFQTRFDNLKKYVSNPPQLRLIHFRGEST